jgi:2',3'-cyclic-nucleotide 2'-phosphodiesterase (5'-nucleotidase family)
MFRKIVGLTFAAALATHAQTHVLFEDFEDAVVAYTTSIEETSDGEYDYFGRVGTDGITINSYYNEFENAQGTGFFAAMDLDATGTGDPNASGAHATLTWSNLNIAGLDSLQFSALFAEDDAYDGAEDWDSSDDYVLVEYQIDGGGWIRLLRFENDGTTYNAAPLQDTDFDEIGDGTELTDTFAAFSADIAGTGSALDLRITIDLNSGDEDIAIDNVTISAGGSGEIAVSVDDVSGFDAMTAAADQIDLFWALNSSNDAVVVARSTHATFGTPESGTAYAAGDSISGGGTVVYTGTATGFSDSGLSSDSGYYYAIWSVDAFTNYSDGVSAYALAAAYEEGIHLIHVNDVHSRLTTHMYDITGTNDVRELEEVGGMDYMAAKILELKQANPGSLILDAGDISEGSPLGDLRYNGGLIDCYNMLDAKLKALGGRGIDAAVVGNHDMRHIGMVTNMMNANFPFISMNIVYKDTDELAFDPYVTVIADGKKVGILGYTTDTSTHLEETTELIFDVWTCSWNDDETDVQIKEYVDYLRDEEKCDVVVLLMHVGHSRAASDSSSAWQLVEDDGETEPPDIAVAGHWHTMTETVWQPSDINHKMVIAEAASYCQYVGEVELTDEGDYVNAWKNVIRCEDITPEPDMTALIDELKVEYAANPHTNYNGTGETYALDQVIGYSADELRMNKNKWFTHAEYPWAGDNNAGAWVADSMQWYVDTQTTNRCDLALQSGGGVRRDNDSGEITYLELYETYPWADDNMVLMQVEGSKIWEFIEEDHCGTSISQGWEVYANDGVVSNITYNGEALDINGLYWVCVSQYMYDYDNDWTDGGWDGATEMELDYSIRQTMIDYTSQFTAANPMTIEGPRYYLNTSSAGRFRAVVTLVDDANSEPYYESAFIRLLSATDDTVERRGGYVDETLVNADGSINQEHELAEVMLYRSYLGFEQGALTNGMIIDVQGEFGFYAGNAQFIDQNGIVSDGVEFRIVGTNSALALPDYKGAISAFWDDHHENHYVVFEGEKTGDSTIADREGTQITVYKEGGYYTDSLPGEVGDMLQVTGLQTMRYDERRFRLDVAEVIGEVDYTPVSEVTGIVVEELLPGETTTQWLYATASDTAEQSGVSLAPSSDAHVVENNPTYNYGSYSSMYLQSADTNNSYGNERILAQFDLSAVASNATVNSAELKLYCYNEYASSNLVVDLYSVADDSWDEDSVTWGSQPALSEVEATATLVDGDTYVWYSFDVADFIAAEFAGDQTASLTLRARTEGLSASQSFVFDSKEYGSYSPVLNVGYADALTVGGSVTNLDFYYAYSTDGANWSDWMLAGSATSSPWRMEWNDPQGQVWYKFYSVATDNAGHVEPAPTLADFSVSGDQDDDGILDEFEQQYFGGLDAADELTDADGDGLLDIEEADAGTSPLLTDSDGDLLPDAYEVGSGLSPTNSADLLTDSDGDGVSDVDEYDYGTDADNAGDRFSAQAGSSNDAFAVSFETVAGHQYVVQESSALDIWHNGLVVDGEDDEVVVEYLTTNDSRFFHVDGAVDAGAPVAKICVISDPHYMEPSLLETNANTYFQLYLAQDRKLIEESHDIMEATVELIIAEQPDVLLIPGDLTKDGERVSHQSLSNFFARVEAEGIAVVLCPGNHDINNAHAVRYIGTNAYEAVDSITPAQFTNNYSHCGYGEAISRDTNSLSFVTEPVSNLWILSIDSAQYIPTSSTGGYVEPETLAWVEDVLADANANGKTVLSMMHHGVVPHYAYQTALFPEYVVSNYVDVAETLAQGGCGAVFTGHYHANDVVKYTSTNRCDVLFDIETGSSVTWPCPYRVIFLTVDGALNVGTKKIEAVEGIDDFQTYAESYLETGLSTVADYMLVYEYGVSLNDAAVLSPAMVSTFMAHYAGDEGTPDAYTQAVMESLLASTNATEQLFGAVIYSMWDDPAPADNEVRLNTQTGGAASK